MTGIAAAQVFGATLAWIACTAHLYPGGMDRYADRLESADHAAYEASESNESRWDRAGFSR